jgi:hypothetical protein
VLPKTNENKIIRTEIVIISFKDGDAFGADKIRMLDSKNTDSPNIFLSIRMLNQFRYHEYSLPSNA